MTTLVLSPRAEREIDEIHDFIARDNALAAQKVVDRIHAVIALLVVNPRMGHEALTGDMRMFVVTPYPYLIYFRHFPRLDELRVVSVRHSARRRTVQLREEPAEFRV